MKLKSNYLFKSMLILLCLCAYIPINFTNPFRGTVLHLESWSTLLPGFDSHLLDKQIAESMAAPKVFRDLGYVLKALSHHLPDWLMFSNAPLFNKKTDILLRSEIADDFESEPLWRMITDHVERGAKAAAQAEAQLGSKIAILMIPEKNASNRHTPPLDDLPEENRLHFGISHQTPRVGSFVVQQRAEDLFRQKGVKVLSLVDHFKELQKINPDLPLYPYADTHWSRRTLFTSGKVLAQMILKYFQLPAQCGIELPLSFSTTESVYGELIKSLRLNVAIPWVTSQFGFEDLADFSKTLSTPTHLASCPPVIFAGSSYGAQYLGEGDITQAISLYYRGSVLNRSQRGVRANESLQKLKIEPESLVIWEFPFRALKLETFE